MIFSSNIDAQLGIQNSAISHQKKCSPSSWQDLLQFRLMVRKDTEEVLLDHPLLKPLQKATFDKDPWNLSRPLTEAEGAKQIAAEVCEKGQ